MTGKSTGFEFAAEPIVRQDSGVMVGMELLARNSGIWSQDKWRAWYHNVLSLIHIARTELDAGNAWFSINVDTEQLADRIIYAALQKLPQHVVLEWTERLPRKHGKQHDLLMRAVDRLHTLRRDHGLRIAFDDMGHGGIDGYQRIGLLHPDIIKIDGHVLQGARRNAMQRAIMRSLVSMGRDINADIIVEWIEGPDDIATAKHHNVDLEQGWWHGRYEFDETGSLVKSIRYANLEKEASQQNNGTEGPIP